MVRLEWIFLMQFVQGFLMFIFLQKLNKMKKQIDDITNEVKNYIAYITEDIDSMSIEVEKESKNQVKKVTEDTQNRLIQAVLSEYFP